MNHLFFLLTLAAYIGSFAAYSGYLVAGREWSGRLGSLFLTAGLVAHYFALLERARGLHTVPYHDLSGSMSLFGWLLALTYLSLELFHRQGAVGAVVLPVVGAFFLFAELSPPDRLAPPPGAGGTRALPDTRRTLRYAGSARACVM